MSDPDYSTWLTKQQAAAEIRCSTKTIEKLVHDGLIRQATWRRQHGPALAVCDPADVERVASEWPRRPLTGVVVRGPADAPPPADRPALVAAAPADLEPQRVLAAALSTFAAALRSVAGEEADMSEKFLRTPAPLFLTLQEAAVVSGLSQACLRRLITAGSLKAIRDRGWKIRRTELESLTTT
jgi:excisionase family DNA binding protein